MRAIVLEKFGGLDSLVIKEIPEPEPKPGHVVIQIKAFGINHAEMHMRRGEWAEAAPVSGIECVGIVKSCPGGEFPVGAKVAALMGGLGRTINGSYAEFTRAPVSNVALIGSELRGPNSRPFLKPTQPPGPACSAVWKFRKGSCPPAYHRRVAGLEGSQGLRGADVRQFGFVSEGALRGCGDDQCRDRRYGEGVFRPRHR